MAKILQFRRPEPSPSHDNTERVAEENRKTAEIIVLRKMRTVLRKSAAS